MFRMVLRTLLVMLLGFSYMRYVRVQGATFVQITGIHMDLHYQVGAPATCVMGLLGLPCCRASSQPPSQSNPNQDQSNNLVRPAGPHGDLNCDSPPSLVNQTLQAIAALNPDFVLDMGDRVGHHLLNQSFEENLGTMAYASTLMSFWNLTVYPTIGNHDTWPIDQWPDAPYTQDLTVPYSKFFFSSFSSFSSSSFVEGGYYSLLLQPSIRLVVLNSLWEDALNLMDVKHGPANQRAWLNATLAQAEQSYETVWLVAHVYPGSNEAKQGWSDFLASIVRRYGSTIRYLFFGHTHLDDFIVFDTQAHAGWMPGSIVPFRDHMPSFRVYEWNDTSGQILDYVQYRAHLNDLELRFRPVYRASETFGLSDMEGLSWYEFWKRMKHDPTLFETWWSLHGTGNPTLAPCDAACTQVMLDQRYIHI